jgi:hypothetical protein
VVAVLDALNRVLGPLCADIHAALQSQND